MLYVQALRLIDLGTFSLNCIIFSRDRRFSPKTKILGKSSNRLHMQEHQGVVTRAKAKQLKSHKDQIEQEKFQGVNVQGKLPRKKNHFEDLLKVPKASRDVTNLSNQQREVSPHGSLNVTTPRSNGPFDCSRTTEVHQPPHFDEALHPPLYDGRKGGFGGRGMPRHFDKVPRPQARHGEPFVANRGRGLGDQTLDRMKWKLPSFKGENCMRQVENIFMLKSCNEFLKARLVIAEFSSYALH
ncbi:hypothetical protein M9H77_08041 [Catharanthus roseus]|uniref:Uncharacterized protein n=1 Tax=Catharanthus roseus TaxID=4058 RepID=A0ACC0BWS8_CATRO|nr:hypothetical protein M9H77_08041 [Catharanthus roseus]